MWSHGTFHWNELMTRDAEKAKAFYAETIGWSFEAMPMPQGGTYWIAKMGDKPAAGLFPLHDPAFAEVPESWMAYLAVDDVRHWFHPGFAAGEQTYRLRSSPARASLRAAGRTGCTGALTCPCSLPSCGCALALHARGRAWTMTCRHCT